MAWVWPKEPEPSPRFQKKQVLSERAEFPFMKPGYNSTVQHAPFGNDYSITFEEKIIGGNLTKVVKRQPIDTSERSPRNLPRLETFQPLTDKPNEINPDVIRSYLVANQAQDLSITQATGKPTLLASKRPDSKDLAHRYSVLQPIEQNRTKNKTSTVFEPEPGVMQKTQLNENRSVDQYKDTNAQTSYEPEKYYPANASPRNVPLWSRNGAVVQRPQESFTKRVLEDDLRYNNPGDSYLPHHPVTYSPEEEVRILQQMGGELRGVTMDQLKQAYLIMTERDKALTGWCDFKHIEYSLSSSRIDLPPELLRISASQFVSSDDPQQVNYEKLLSFIGTAIKQTSEESWPLALYSPRDYHGRPQYFQTDSQQIVLKNSKPPTPAYPDQETAKLLSLTETQLRDSGQPVDFEKLIASFQMADRDLRGTLSAEQIKDVCRQNQIPLQDSLLNQILNRCEDTSPEGIRSRLQYHWTKFVEFLERVQPAHTGLRLPTSKKPLEYAKQYPSPVPNWPKPADSGIPDTPLWRKEESPRKGYDRPSYESPKPRYDEPQMSQREMNQNIQGLELEYEDMKRRVNQGNVSHRERETEWFPRFMRLANALYDQDRLHHGCLPVSTIWDVTKLHNEGYDLGIPDHIITKVIGEAAHGNMVDIHRYLTKLGSRDWL